MLPKLSRIPWPYMHSFLWIISTLIFELLTNVCTECDRQRYLYTLDRKRADKNDILVERET